MMREEEEAALAAAGEPMRNYLVHHIFPTLTPALLEVAKLRPDDPIDFLVSKLSIKSLFTYVNDQQVILENVLCFKNSNG